MWIMQVDELFYSVSCCQNFFLDPDLVRFFNILMSRGIILEDFWLINYRITKKYFNKSLIEREHSRGIV